MPQNSSGERSDLVLYGGREMVSTVPLSSPGGGPLTPSWLLSP